jgi:hypothetical protein
MKPNPTPFELVTALQRGDLAARAVLETWCRPLVSQVIAAITKRDALKAAEARMFTDRALRWLEMYLQNRDPAVYREIGRDTFVKSLGVAAVRLLDPRRPEGVANTQPSRVEPSHETYEIRAHVQPLESVGGDWWEHDAIPGQDFWVIVGDVTGHGYGAYLVACGLPHLWRTRSIASLRAGRIEPGEFLSVLGKTLERVLPEGVFVEAVLGRFTETGEACLAAAGGCRPILKRAKSSEVEFHTLRGTFLGLEIGERDQTAWRLEHGDELLMATDGLFDQPYDTEQRLGARLEELVRKPSGVDMSLHEIVLKILQITLRRSAQFDDIMVVTVRHRRTATPAQGNADAGM